MYLLFGLVGGPLVFGFLDIDIETVELRVLVDMTLALVLFSDAANADLGVLRTYSQLPARMLPVVVALAGTGEKLEAKLFLAWFGPRGLASIVFMVIVGAANLPGESVMIHVVVCTITLCVVFHGITANAWARGIAGRFGSG